MPTDNKPSTQVRPLADTRQAGGTTFKETRNIQMNNPRQTPTLPLLTVRGFHQALGGAVGINTLRRAVRDGRIRSIQLGERKRLIPTTELADWPQREGGERE